MSIKKKMQYNSSNAWNVNTNNGNVNNNDKSNGNRVRAVAEYRNTIKDRYIVPLEDILEAYFHCRKNKRGTYNALEFEVDYRYKCLELWREVNGRTYEIGRSICFIVNKPTKREVFAASFRDRVIHHYVCMRLEPLFEKYLYPCMKSNRKGKGSSDAIREVFEIIQKNPNGRIYKFDLQGFFMSIDKRILWSHLERFIIERYKGDDIDVILWLTRKIVMHCPQKNCIRKCPTSEWEGLAANKSLFNQDEFHGLAIGNLTSQMFANFLLKPVMDYLYASGIVNTVQYVDDFFNEVEQNFPLTDFIPELREYLRLSGIALHPRKCYIQHASKGVKFLGTIISPYRVYSSNRTIGNAFKKIHWLVDNECNVDRFRDIVNSYFGYMRYTSSYKIRKRLAEYILARRKEFYFGNDLTKVVVKTIYKTKYKITQRLRAA